MSGLTLGLICLGVGFTTLVNGCIGVFLLVYFDTPDHRWWKWINSDPSEGVFSYILMQAWPYYLWRIWKDRHGR